LGKPGSFFTQAQYSQAYLLGNALGRMEYE